MGQGRIYLVSCRVNCRHLCEIQGMTNCSPTSILVFRNSTNLLNTYLHGSHLRVWAKWKEEAHIRFTSLRRRCFLTHPRRLHWHAVAHWDFSSPQAAIWKSRKEWRYAGRGTSGPLWGCTVRKCNGWWIYTLSGPDMDLYFCFYKPVKRSAVTCLWQDYLSVMLNDSLIISALELD